MRICHRPRRQIKLICTSPAFHHFPMTTKRVVISGSGDADVGKIGLNIAPVNITRTVKNIGCAIPIQICAFNRHIRISVIKRHILPVFGQNKCIRSRSTDQGIANTNRLKAIIAPKPVYLVNIGSPGQAVIRIRSDDLGQGVLLWVDRA